MIRMTHYSITIIFGFTCHAILSYSLPIADENDAELYLKEDGFLEEYADNETLAMTNSEAVSNEIMDFQRFTRLNEIDSRYQKTSRDENVEDAPDICEDARIDTVTRTKNGDLYIFKGHFYWRVLRDGTFEGYPRKISEDWGGLEGNLDASITFQNGKTFFFKGSHYWRFTDKKMHHGYPKLISVGFPGIPDKLDAALVWSGNNKKYFFKGDKYWRYDCNTIPHVSSGFPASITEWSDLLVNGIDASLQYTDNRTFFFKGDQYYRYNDETAEVAEADPPYPRPTAPWWFVCQQFNHTTSTEATETTTEATDIITEATEIMTEATETITEEADDNNIGI